MMRTIARCLALAALWRTAAAADDPASTAIATDRPAVTDSSVVVPFGSLQFENGFEASSSNGQPTFDATETLMRLGIASKTELRLLAPDYFGQPGLGSGLGDLAAGIQQQLGPAAGFDVSLVLMLSFPTGARDFSSHGYDPSLQIPWSRTLSPNWTVAGMFSVYWPTQATRRNLTGETTFLFDRQLTKPWDAFVEYAGDFPQLGGPRQLIHLGTAYKIGPQQQLDLHVGVGLSSAAVDRFIGAGYSIRFQLFRR